MVQKNPSLTAAEAELILEENAIYLAPGCRDVFDRISLFEYCWGADATGAGLVDAAAALLAIP
jgi:hypothetical protein